MTSRRLALVAMVVLTLSMVVPAAVAQEPIPDWPDHYNAQELLTYHLKLTSADYEIIRYDLTNDIELPALFWAAGDEYGYVPDDPILVSVRRKSDAWPDEVNPQKLSFKIDINEYHDEDEAGNDICTETGVFENPTCQSKWHSVKKVDLENGMGSDVVVEGMAWYLHELAGESGVVDYLASDTSWVKLYITLIDGEGNEDQPFYAGLFVNVQQRDKTFLKNHDLYEGNLNTWLYKQEIGEVEIEVEPEDENGDPLGISSPALEALNFAPFQVGQGPTGQAFVDTLNNWINMEGLLTFGAVSAFHTSPDGLFASGQNAIFLDYGGEVDPHSNPREYIAWDLDSVFRGKDVDSDIYEQGKRDNRDYYQDLILNTPGNTTVFRDQFTDIMRDLLYGPFQVATLIDATYDFEALLGAAIAADPYAIEGQEVGEYFAGFRDWITARHANVLSQVGAPPLPVPQVTITSPEEASTVSGSVVVTADASDPDGDGVTQVEFFAEGTSIGIDTDGGDGWSAPWDTTATPDGLRSVSATATNTAGQTATDAIQVIVDNEDSPPVVTITNPAGGDIVSGLVDVSADASDDVGVTQVEFFVEGDSIGLDTNGGDGWSATWDTTSGPDGPYAVSATATDTAGQTASDSVAVTVNNAAPPLWVHVGDLDGTSIFVSKFDWYATVTIAVHDAKHGAVEGAVVSGIWGIDASGEGTCTTDADGTCTVDSSVMGKKQRRVSFTISDVALGGYTYDASSNHDPDGDSNGTTISFRK